MGCAGKEDGWGGEWPGFLSQTKRRGGWFLLLDIHGCFFFLSVSLISRSSRWIGKMCYGSTRFELVKLAGFW